MGTVATVEDFWQLHQLIKPPSRLGLANDYAMFRQVYSSNYDCQEMSCSTSFCPDYMMTGSESRLGRPCKLWWWQVTDASPFLEEGGTFLT